jgi:hypothetical protein
LLERNPVCLNPPIEEKVFAESSAPSPPLGASRARLAAAVVLALASGGATGLAVRGGDDADTSPAATAAGAFGPAIVTPSELRERVAALGRRVYWIGADDGRSLELTVTAKSDVFLRYLPPGAAAGDKRAFLTVGTYSLPNGDAVTRGIGREPGAVSRQLTGGRIAVFRRSRPTSVYVSWPTLDYQVEVYSPVPGEAKRLAYSTRLTLVGG